MQRKCSSVSVETNVDEINNLDPKKGSQRSEVPTNIIEMNIDIVDTFLQSVSQSINQAITNGLISREL